MNKAWKITFAVILIISAGLLYSIFDDNLLDINQSLNINELKSKIEENDNLINRYYEENIDLQDSIAKMHQSACKANLLCNFEPIPDSTIKEIVFDTWHDLVDEEDGGISEREHNAYVAILDSFPKFLTAPLSLDSLLGIVCSDTSLTMDYKNLKFRTIERDVHTSYAVAKVIDFYTNLPDSNAQKAWAGVMVEVKADSALAIAKADSSSIDSSATNPNARISEEGEVAEFSVSEAQVTLLKKGGLTFRGLPISFSKDFTQARIGEEGEWLTGKTSSDSKLIFTYQGKNELETRTYNGLTLTFKGEVVTPSVTRQQ